MLDAVATLVDELQIPPEAGSLAQSFTITDRLEARQYAALEAFDRRVRGRHRPHLELVLDPYTQHTTFHDGTPVPTSTLERLCCDAIVHDVVIDNGQVLFYGRARRTITTSHPTRTSRPPGNHQPPLHT